MSGPPRGLGSGAEDRSLLEIARGAVSAHTTFRLSGLNRSVTGVETIWPLGGSYTFPTVVQPLRIKAGGNAEDDAGGSGAREIRLRGLDGSFELLTETLATSGAGASASTSGSFSRLNEVIVTQAGSYDGTNIGNIFVEGETNGDVYGGIEAGTGISRVGVATIPAGWTAYAVGGAFGVDGVAAIELWERRRADEGSAPFGPARNLLRRSGVASHTPISLGVYVEIPEKTDLWFTADGVAAEVSVELELILVNDAAQDPA